MRSPLAHFHDDINRLCVKHQVKRLDIFGSATGDGFRPATSDVDFLVEFADLSPGDYAEHYFALKEGLTTLLGREVDLVVERAIKNPFFLESVALSRESLFTVTQTSMTSSYGDSSALHCASS